MYWSIPKVIISIVCNILPCFFGITLSYSSLTTLLMLVLESWILTDWDYVNVSSLSKRGQSCDDSVLCHKLLQHTKHSLTYHWTSKLQSLQTCQYKLLQKWSCHSKVYFREPEMSVVTSLWYNFQTLQRHGQRSKRGWEHGLSQVWIRLVRRSKTETIPWLWILPLAEAFWFEWVNSLSLYPSTGRLKVQELVVAQRNRK